jgi:type VI protein secretion system component Hcp
MPIYMKYEGIVGTAKGKHSGWIELESCQFRRDGISGGNRAGNIQINPEIVISKYNDKASVLLFTESLSGKKPPKKVIIDFVKAGEEVPYMSIELENIIISSYNLSGTGVSGDVVPMESLSLNYTKISNSLKPTVTPKDPKQANDKAGFNAVINK